MTAISTLMLSFAMLHTTEAEIRWFESRIDTLPDVTLQVEDPSAFVSFANELIRVGPAKTWTLIDSFCAKADSDQIPMSALAGPPSRPWCKLLVVLPLLYSWRIPEDLGTLPAQCVPADFPIAKFENGLIYIRKFLIRFDRNPRTLSGALRTIDWRLFRNSAMKPAKSINDEMVKSLAIDFREYSKDGYNLITRQSENFQKSFKADYLQGRS